MTAIGRIARYATIEAMPATAQALLDAPEQGLFRGRAWFESFVAAGLAAGARPEFLTLASLDGAIRAILPCQSLPPGPADAPTAAGLSSFYSCDFRPILADPNDAESAFAIGRAAAAIFAREPSIRFDSLDSTAASLPPFLKGLYRPGRALLRYRHFGRWWEPVPEGGFAAYLAARDGALRETIRRKGARLERDGATLAFVPAEQVERGVADYETVYAASWKEPEPFPDFQPTLMRNLAKTGQLRLAVCRLGDRPIAAQLWVATGGTATVLKLAHDQAFDRHSPGTVLTAFAIRRLIEDDRVDRIDFGRGDDGYKRAWATRRTPHIGVLSVRIASRPMAIARHYLGAALRAAHFVGAQPGASSSEGRTRSAGRAPHD